MPCKTCATESALQVCLFCGHSFCSAHRTERDGVTCCTPCNDAEHARRSGRAEVARAASGRAPASESARLGEAIGTLVPGGAPPPPPPPIPEAGWWPTLVGLAAGGVAGGYLWWLTRWLLAGEEAAPAWAPQAAGGAGGALVFAALWIIVKSRLS